MQNNKLLPCPFCGGKPRVVYAIHDYNMWGVYCDDCGASVETDKVADTEENAVKLWNTRKQMERIMEQLEKQKEETYNRCIRGMFDVVFKDITKIVSNGGKE